MRTCFLDWLTVSLGVVELVVYSGYALGFNALIPVYKNQSLFAQPHGPSSNQSIHHKQDVMFGYALVTWIVGESLLLPLLTGLINFFALGHLWRKLAAIALSAVGSLLFAYTAAPTAYLLFFAGVASLTGGTLSEICNQQLNLVQPRHSGFIISLMAGAYDASLGVPLVIVGLAKVMSLQTAFLLLTGLGSGVGICVVLLSFRKSSEPGTEPVESQSYRKSIALMIDQSLEKQYPNVKKTVRSWPYLLYLAWCTSASLCFVLFLSTLPISLDAAFPNDPHMVTYLLKIFSIVGFGGLIVNPIFGLFIDWIKKRHEAAIIQWLGARIGDNDTNGLYHKHCCRIVLPMMTLAIANLSLAVLMIFKPMAVFIAAFIVFPIYRALLFTSIPFVLLTLFPSDQFPTLISIVYCFGGLFSLVQYLMIQLTIYHISAINCSVSMVVLVSSIVLYYVLFGSDAE